MATILSIGAYIAIFIAALLLADAIVGFIRAARGFDEGAVERRLTQAQAAQTTTGERIELLRARARSNSLLFELFGPLYERFVRFVRQSHLNLTADRALGVMGLIALVT